MAVIVDISGTQKEFVHEITKAFTFEELALYMYENECLYCEKEHNCMGSNCTAQECVKHIRSKFENAYFSDEGADNETDN